MKELLAYQIAFDIAEAVPYQSRKEICQKLGFAQYEETIRLDESSSSSEDYLDEHDDFNIRVKRAPGARNLSQSFEDDFGEGYFLSNDIYLKMLNKGSKNNAESKRKDNNEKSRTQVNESKHDNEREKKINNNDLQEKE